MLTKTNAPSLDNFWMPFTANRQFKAAPRLLASASGMYYTDVDGNQVLDGTAGLWCCNAGHGRKRITEAVERQISTMDFAPTFQMGHNVAFDFAEKLAAIAPGGAEAKLDRVFFTNSGSESVDTALKIAIAYQRAIGQGTRTMVLGREKGYHGVGFGGISVGGLVNNRRVFPQIPADHLRHTLDIEKNAFSKGLPANGIELADDLERLVQLHGAEKIAAVIVEPMSGSAGVILPPKGYLERIRATADKYGILLIFDEVITGFGRLGTPFAVDYFGVVPDLVTTAKGLTNGAIPMGAVFAARKVYDGLMTGPENAIELFHGYTYSGHPVASAAGLATLEIYAEEGLLTRGAGLADYWQEALHSLKGAPNVIDIRNLGLVGAVELASRKDAPGARAYDIFVECFKKGLLIRVTGDVIALSPPLIIEKEQIDTIISVLGDAIKRAA
ncbi:MULTISPECIES: aspartate aminotransferase family protein [unclassified Brucella]|uniref:aspartate aminotransferase family protein n=1 Tax=unclassified Brucella TaxID=2632610 RepID=UPI0001E446D1|nr:MULTISPECIES: aspartate aminotransferase family protein [unclassified Brucella]APY16098.1 aspartate aminotransferase family protein [Brucella sp. 09RB8910]EFM59985.1 beta alanine--pyruvate transaminase [Brucella sp. BO2]MRN44371.1 aminotransferase class III-fold pyridoxal phosphate-dependent enzyme [Brucella sp. 09RB8913]MRN47392.1 aminotransferase class III-fold pyridoxal phosphate-dependent enzyme [Brucella sp. 10RB9212]MRN50242.1 aminotransferase class III-fold pyridoxal phosphate-depend